MTSERELKTERRPSDRVVDLAGWFLLAAFWGLVISKYTVLPDVIPVHYDAMGQADRFGGKIQILFLPGIATLVFGGMSFLSRYQHKFNYPVRITSDNARIQYLYAGRLMRYIRLIIVLIFGLVAYETIRNTETGSEGLGVWFLPLTLGLIFIPLGIYIVQARKKR
jgi:hypothetical protein